MAQLESEAILLKNPGIFNSKKKTALELIPPQ